MGTFDTTTSGERGQPVSKSAAVSSQGKSQIFQRDRDQLEGFRMGLQVKKNNAIALKS